MLRPLFHVLLSLRQASRRQASLRQTLDRLDRQGGLRKPDGRDGFWRKPASKRTGWTKLVAGALLIGFSGSPHLAAQGPDTGSQAKPDYRDAHVDSLSGRARYAAAVEVLTKVDPYDYQQMRYWRAYTAPMAQEWPADTLTLRRAVTITPHLRNGGNFSAAYRLAREAIDLARDIDRPDFLPIAYLEAGTSLGEFDAPAALPLLDSAILWAERYGERRTATTGYIHKAYALSLIEPMDEAAYMANLDAACALACDGSLLEEQLTLNYHYVTFYAERGDYASAEAYAKTSYAVATAMGGGLYDLMPRQMTAVIARERGDYTEALRLSESARVALESIEHREGLLELYPFIIELYELVGDYRAAHELNQRFVAMRDSMLSLQKTQLVQDLEAQYGAEQRQATIEHQEAELRSSRLVQALLAAGLLGTLLLSFGIARQRRESQRANAELAKLHVQERAQNDRLNVLMAELHHRVKNNLQTISSLLRLQSRQTGDENARAALQAGQMRVEVMSVLHQRLYESDNLELVNVAQVIPDLVEKTVFGYQMRPSRQTHDYDIEVEVLEVSRAMPLCLIANELITNSCKYAHDDVADLRLAISLRRNGDELVFAYADNGSGATISSAATDAKSGFGTKLIGALASQLNARVEWGAGHACVLRFGNA